MRAQRFGCSHSPSVIPVRYGWRQSAQAQQARFPYASVPGMTGCRDRLSDRGCRWSEWLVALNHGRQPQPAPGRQAAVDRARPRLPSPSASAASAGSTWWWQARQGAQPAARSCVAAAGVRILGAGVSEVCRDAAGAGALWLSARCWGKRGAGHRQVANQVVRTESPAGRSDGKPRCCNHLGAAAERCIRWA